MHRAIGLILILLVTQGTSCADANARGQLREQLRERLRQRLSKGESGGSRRQTGAEMQVIAGLNCAIWRPAHENSPAPLILFSHGFRGVNVQSADLMKALANAGYLVLAPNHKDAIGGGHGGRPQEPLGRPGQWTETTYRDRGEDIQKLMTALQRDTRWNSQIDWSKVTLMGHSLGGYTVLALAGGWRSWKMNGIKAVVALSPYCHPFNRSGNIAGLNMPVMYQTGTLDVGVAPFLKGKKGTFSRTSSPAYLVDIKGANHFTWTNLNKQENRENLIEYYCISFLDKFVKGDPAAKPEARLTGVSAVSVK